MGADVRPLARSDRLFVETIGDELLVYDEERTLAHSLNGVAAQVWQACDGARDVDALAAHTGLDPEVVELSLTELQGCNLLTMASASDASDGSGVSRRSVLRRVVVTGAAVGVTLPVIRSIVAPSAALAACSGTAGTCPQGLHTKFSGSSANSTCVCQVGSCACASGGGANGNGRCRPTSVCNSSFFANPHCNPFSACTP